MTGKNWKTLLQVLLVILLAAGVKYQYSSANVDHLGWVLAPSTWAVEAVTGIDFYYENHSGYLNPDRTFLIAASCSGVNFLVTAFLALSIGAIWRKREEGASWRSLILYAALAYATTIVANTVRISTALRLREVPAETGLFSDAQVHRLEGIAVYFGFLLLLFWLSGIGESSDRNRSRSHGRLGIPLLLYYSMTLGIPFANGAYLQGFIFWEHAAFVVITPLLMILPFLAARRLTTKIFAW